jgi:hypothetical protein
MTNLDFWIDAKCSTTAEFPTYSLEQESLIINSKPWQQISPE